MRYNVFFYDIFKMFSSRYYEFLFVSHNYFPFGSDIDDCEQHGNYKFLQNYSTIPTKSNTFSLCILLSIEQYTRVFIGDT
jgi:hypothetical protein